MGSFACVSLFLWPHPSASVSLCVCVCVYGCALLFVNLFIWFYLDVFAFVCSFLCSVIYLIWCGCIRLRGHIPVRVCVCAWPCPSFCKIIHLIWCRCICLCVSCVHFRFVCFFYWGYILVRVCVGMAVLSFLQNDSIWIDVGAFACASFVHIHFVFLFSLVPIPVRVFMLVCVHSCSLYFALIFIKCLLDAFACVYLFLGPHSSARVFMYVFVCMAIPIFSHHYSSFFIDVHSLVCHNSLGHIPVRVLMCVCNRCTFFFAPLLFSCHLGAFAFAFLFLGSHFSASIECYVCMAVPFFKHHFTSNVMWVHSLVCHFSWGHISVRVCVCVHGYFLPFFWKIIDLSWCK